jgi:hypothetical protein
VRFSFSPPAFDSATNSKVCSVENAVAHRSERSLQTIAMTCQEPNRAAYIATIYWRARSLGFESEQCQIYVLLYIFESDFGIQPASYQLSTQEVFTEGTVVAARN